ncbi:MAG TPA: PDZ domain-containing protein [Terracidiphilus sp.]|jgi:serine protease Do|nr:PDZ domain-containing protein [Terracidiphilus sp.]
MKYFSRPYRNLSHRKLLSAGIALLVTAGAACGVPYAFAQASGLAGLLEDPSPILHSSSQGYLGVLVGDVDSDSAAKLKLKDLRGAVVTLLDHDAPAAQAGIRVNDVVVQVNGQTVESAEAFTRMLREIPAGRKVTLAISRDGALQNLTIELVDHKKMEHDVWNRLDNGGDSVSSAPAMGILSGGGGDIPSGGFHMPLFGSTLNVGAMVEPLTSQMADYLGIQSGLMVKQVSRKSEAETAGLKAFDIILKVGTDNIATTADWDRALRSNQDKPVQVTVLRDRKQQVLTLQVDSKHHRSELEDLLPDNNCPLMAALDPDSAAELAQELAGDDSMAQSMRNQVEPLRNQFGGLNFGLSPEQAEQLQEQLKGKGFQFDQKQLDELKNQADLFRKNFNADEFKIDPKLNEELQKQMEQFPQNFNMDGFKLGKKQLDEFNKQMRQFQSPEFQKEFQDQMRRQMDQLERQFEEMQDEGTPHFV